MSLTAALPTLPVMASVCRLHGGPPMLSIILVPCISRCDSLSQRLLECRCSGVSVSLMGCPWM